MVLMRITRFMEMTLAIALSVLASAHARAQDSHIGNLTGRGKGARQETVIDVDSHQEVHRTIFSDPKTWDARVIVPANGTAKVDFELSDE